MCVRTLHRYVKHLSSQNIAGADATADHGSARSVDAGVRSLGAAQTEFHDAIAFRCPYDAGSLCRDQALMIDDIQHRCLDQLRFHNRSHDLNQRLVWEYDGAFRNRVQVPGKMEAAQIFQKVGVEDTETAQVGDIVIGELQVLDIIDDLFQTGCDGVAASAGVVSIKDIEDNGFVVVLFKIALHHGKFVKICHQG